MTELIVHVTVGLMVGQVPSPGDLSVGEGRGLLAQRHGRYVAGSAGHRDRTPPDLAATLIDRYSNPGDLIVDPFAGTGTMLLEAVHAGREGLGMDIEPGWVSLARANLALARRQGATGRARIVHGDATRLPTRMPTGLRGTVDVVLTSAPTGATMPVYRFGRRRPAASARGGRRSRTGRVEVAAGLGRVLAGCATLLRPGGLAGFVIRRRPDQQCVADCAPDHLIRAGLRAGLEVVDYHYANHRGQLARRLRGDDLTQPPRAVTGAVVLLPGVAAHDILVFAKPPTGEGSR